MFDRVFARSGPARVFRESVRSRVAARVVARIGSQVLVVSSRLYHTDYIERKIDRRFVVIFNRSLLKTPKL